jgi:hypothetical protein
MSEVRKALRHFFPEISDHIHSIALSSYTQNAFRAIAHRMLQNQLCGALYGRISYLRYEGGVIDRVADEAWNDKTQREKNARGVWERLQDRVLSLMLEMTRTIEEQEEVERVGKSLGRWWPCPWCAYNSREQYVLLLRDCTDCKCVCGGVCLCGRGVCVERVVDTGNTLSCLALVDTNKMEL